MMETNKGVVAWKWRRCMLWNLALVCCGSSLLVCQGVAGMEFRSFCRELEVNPYGLGSRQATVLTQRSDNIGKLINSASRMLQDVARTTEDVFGEALSLTLAASFGVIDLEAYHLYIVQGAVCLTRNCSFDRRHASGLEAVVDSVWDICESYKGRSKDFVRDKWSLVVDNARTSFKEAVKERGRQIGPQFYSRLDASMYKSIVMPPTMTSQKTSIVADVVGRLREANRRMTKTHESLHLIAFSLAGIWRACSCDSLSEDDIKTNLVTEMPGRWGRPSAGPALEILRRYNIPHPLSVARIDYHFKRPSMMFLTQLLNIVRPSSSSFLHDVLSFFLIRAYRIVSEANFYRAMKSWAEDGNVVNPVDLTRHNFPVSSWELMVWHFARVVEYRIEAVGVSSRWDSGGVRDALRTFGTGARTEIDACVPETVARFPNAAMAAGSILSGIELNDLGQYARNHVYREAVVQAPSRRGVHVTFGVADTPRRRGRVTRTTTTHHYAPQSPSPRRRVTRTTTTNHYVPPPPPTTTPRLGFGLNFNFRR